MKGRIAGAVIVLLALVGAVAVASYGSSTTLSPCANVRTGAVASPDGTQIAYYGTRWPPPAHAYDSNNGLQAFCVADANGKNAQPLKYTVCSEKCPDFPYQITWVSQNALLYLGDGPIYSLTPGSKPKKVGIQVNAPSFAIDAAGDRLASGANFPGCVTCHGPVTVFDLSSGALVGNVGGKKFDNLDPSLSPDGSQVVFDRDPDSDSGKTDGIWTANADGSGLHQLEATGSQPLWSPAGNEIAYRTAGYNSGLRIVASHGGNARTLVGKGIEGVFGWSPNGKQIAVDIGAATFKLAVVAVATGKVRDLLVLHGGPRVVWSPDSKTLLAVTNPTRTQCTNLYRVPASGGKPTLLRHC